MAPVSQGPSQMNLLLLPSLSLPVTRSSWWAAYKSTIEHVLSRLRPSDENEVVRLDIAVVLNSTSSSPSTIAASRTDSFAEFQGILREVYSLVRASAVRVQVELDFPGGVDARVFFLDYQPLQSDLAGRQSFSGPVVDLDTFAAAQRPYQVIYAVESEDGEGTLQTLLQLWRSNGTSPPIQRLPCGPSLAVTGREPTTQKEAKVGVDHKNVAVGGTFDHIHIGHKVLLAATVLVTEPGSSSTFNERRNITVGVTGDELLVNKKHGSLVESWEERQEKTAEFVESILVFHPNVPSVRTVEYSDQPGPNGKVVKVTYGNEVSLLYTRISDPFGPPITDESISALVASAETRSGGKAINDKRAEKGWKPLEVFEIDLLDSQVDEHERDPGSEQDFSDKISSTDIRRRLEARARNSSGHL